MGGNALKNTETERKSRVDYLYISGLVCGTLGKLFPKCHALPVHAYRQKETFGDADILLKSDDLPPNWIDMLHEEFKPNEMVINGGVVSFDFHKFQIDLITSPSSEYNFAYTYFAYNDLGNFMGRIARAMGFTYGFDGLWKKLRNPEGQKYADVRMSIDQEAVFAFLGYDYQRWLAGFDTMEEIFAFAASTPYFSRKIFALENRNNKDRVRDMKRPNYNAFLAWMDDKSELDKYEWAPYTGDVMTPERLQERSYWQDRAWDVFPGYAKECLAKLVKYSEQREAKKLWNGDIVREATGMQGKLLGLFMERCRQQHENFEAWVLQQTPASIDSFIKEMLQTKQ